MVLSCLAGQSALEGGWASVRRGDGLQLLHLRRGPGLSDLLKHREPAERLLCGGGELCAADCGGLFCHQGGDVGRSEV